MSGRINILLLDTRNMCRCFPIDIPDSDPHHGEFGHKCLDFTRSSTHCTNNQEDQMNLVTSYLDASVIYGTSDEMAIRFVTMIYLLLNKQRLID